MQLAGLIKELKQEKDLLERTLAGIDGALAAFAVVYKPRPRRHMSVAARGKIAAAQRRRWAKVRKSKRKA